MNGSGFYCTDSAVSPNPSDYDHVVGYQQYKVARNYRVDEMMSQMGKMDINDIKGLSTIRKWLFP